MVDKVLTMIIGQFLSLYHPIHIRLHELLSHNRQSAPTGETRSTHLDEIHLVELLERGGCQDVQNRDDVLMVKMSEEFDLAESSQAEHAMVKGRDTLYCDLSLGGFVYGRARRRNRRALAEVK